MNDRLPPQLQLWNWPTHLEPGQLTRVPATPAAPAAPAAPVRIGDAERDEAVSSLGDHFAAGRLTREEFDTRADEAMAARYAGDLQTLFADLPKTPPQATLTPAVPAPAPAVRSVLPMMLAGWLPFLLVGAVVTAVVLNAPWLIWSLVWVLMISSFVGRGRGGPHYHRR